MTDRLEVVPEDWDRALAVVAHPDDMEYGAASAVARWTDQAKVVSYLLVTRGEAGISTMAPAEVVAIRAGEQQRSCAAVGVEALEYLDRPDGLVQADLDLRHDLAGAIRRHRPEVVLSINFRDTWGGPSWNHADHRNVGIALLDAIRDAGNPWLFDDAGPAWGGARFALFNGSPVAGHGVDVSAHLDRGIASLRCHETYLAHLDAAGDPDEMLRSSAVSTGPRLGVELAVAFELVAF